MYSIIASNLPSKLSSCYPGNHGYGCFSSHVQWAALFMTLLPVISSQGHCKRPGGQEALSPVGVGGLWRSPGTDKGQLEAALHSSTFLPVSPTSPPQERKCLLGIKGFPKERAAHRWEATAGMCLARDSAQLVATSKAGATFLGQCCQACIPCSTGREGLLCSPRWEIQSWLSRGL